MSAWPNNPSIYEINAWVWLDTLSNRYRRPITLQSVPDEEWDALGALHVDAVWLMGVWERSAVGRRIANEDAGLVDEFRRALPGYSERDNVGSPYCVRRYSVDSHLGGPEGLACARRALAARGLRLILDYVPNHLALDHPAVTECPQYFIRGSRDDVERAPQEFFEAEGGIIARGRDPNFPPWPDVAQLNAFSADLRKWALDTVSSIAEQSDGMRCDMAMLMMTDIFKRTWGERAGTPPEREFWPELIDTVKQRHPGTIFIAEAYWDLEFALQQQGFDYCYDKRLYDRLAQDDASAVRAHLGAGIDYQQHLVRFIENHDEPRAAMALQPPGRHRAAAVLATTLPGARLLHEGQDEGKQVRLPVFLGRAPIEPVDEELREFYRRLRAATGSRAFKSGQWSLCEARGWPDNDSNRGIVASAWDCENDRFVVVVNFSPTPSQARIALPWHNLANRSWKLRDHLSGESLDRAGDELANDGLFVDLAPWQCHLLSFED